MLNATRYQNINKRLQPLANGLKFAAICGLLYFSAAATSVAADPPPTPTLTLAWGASASTNVTNYTIYYGTTSGSYTQAVSAGQVTQTTITGLMPGNTYFLAATATDDAGLESLYSNEILFVVPAGRPDLSLPGLSLQRAGADSIVQSLNLGELLYAYEHVERGAAILSIDQMTGWPGSRDRLLDCGAGSEVSARRPAPVPVDS